MSALATGVNDLLALHLIDGLGPHRITALLDRFGSADAIRRARATELLQVAGIGSQLSASIQEALPSVDVAAELRRMTEAGVRALCRDEADYPEALRELAGSPLLLFVRGQILAQDARAVAIVGTRHANSYGKRIARQLADGLARAGVTVVSGLARGIDGIAHQTTLEAGGRTLAVLAGGLSRIYPPEHTALAAQVTHSGALITESTMLQSPTAGRFPARNRIISGLSQVVVIVQAPEKSGSLITAEHAAEQGRLVMAVPGPIDDPQQQGCNRLLREGAVLCRGVEDVLEELDGVSAVASSQMSSAKVGRPQGEPAGLDEAQVRIWQFLGEGPRAVDEIVQTLGLPVPRVSTALMTLELKKAIRKLPGNRYERF